MRLAPFLRDAGLERLRDCPKLKELTPSFCQNVTQKGVDALNESLPDLNVEF